MVNIWEGVASNAIFVALVVLVGWIGYVCVHRRRLVRFFGLDKERRIVIYTSTLKIPPGGSIGVDGQLRSFQGLAIPDYEATRAAELQRVFNSAVPALTGLSGWLRNLRLVDVTAEVQASPLYESGVTRSAPFIAVGSPAYNTAAQRIENAFDVCGRFSKGFATIEVDGHAPLGTDDCALVERAKDRATGQTAFYVAGRSVAGTGGATRYLLENWHRLAKEGKADSRFCLLLKVSPDGSSQEVLYRTS